MALWLPSYLAGNPAAMGGGSSWTPANLPLALWASASNAAFASTLDGASVTPLDASPDALTLTPTAITYARNAIGSKPAFLFNGTSSKLTTTATLFNRTGFCLYAVLKMTTAAKEYVHLARLKGYEGAGWVFGLGKSGNSALGGRGMYCGSWPVTKITSNTFFTNDLLSGGALMWNHNRGGGYGDAAYWQYALNNTRGTLSTWPEAVSGAEGNATVFGNSSDGSVFINASVAELIITKRAITPAEQVLMRGWVQQEYPAISTGWPVSNPTTDLTYDTPHQVIAHGDSIVAGVGTSDNAHRWTELAEAELGADWDIHNNGYTAYTFNQAGNLLQPSDLMGDAPTVADNQWEPWRNNILIVDDARNGMCRDSYDQTGEQQLAYATQYIAERVAASGGNVKIIISEVGSAYGLSFEGGEGGHWAPTFDERRAVYNGGINSTLLHLPGVVGKLAVLSDPYLSAPNGPDDPPNPYFTPADYTHPNDAGHVALKNLAVAALQAVVLRGDF